jgi:hypothetical protein
MPACTDDGNVVSSTVAEASTSASDDVSTGETPTSTSVDTSEDGSASADAETSTASSSGAETSSMTSAPQETGDSSTGELPGVCVLPPACDAPTPDPGELLDWNNVESTFVSNAGAPNHRGRDMFYIPGDDQWVMAKFAYAVNDWDLSGEQIDLYLLRGCEGDWEPLGTATTTFDDEHAEVEGVADSGGRIYFQIPAELELDLGRHRIWAVVRGDATSADVYIEVVEPNTPFFLTDVDGTLTTSENEEFVALLSGNLPLVNANAPEVMWALVEKGYHAFYLTARPEFLGARTRAFLHERGLPPGLYHTTLSLTGATGAAAVDYKSGELDMLAARQLVPSWTFGNTSSDADAYEHAGVQPLSQRIFYQYDDTHGGRRVDDYADLLAELAALEPVCE